MRTSEVIAHYGSRKAVADRLGISRQAISLWEKKGFVPPLSAVLLAKLSNGKLKFDPKVYESWYNKTPARSVNSKRV